ncbi:MAG: AMIN domain-containing protein [Leptolyngbyaceae cyanobacterium]
MKQAQGLTGIILASTAIAAAIQPAIANPVQLTSVQLSPTATGVDIVLQTKGDSTPQVFAVNRGKSWTADVTNTQLAVPGGSYRQANPAPGISLVTVTPIDQNSVRVTVTGTSATPVGKIGSAPQGGLLFSLKPLSPQQSAIPSNMALPPLPAQTAKTQPIAVPLPGPIAQVTVPTIPNTGGAAPTRPTTPPPPSGVPMPPLPTAPGTPLVPNPEITVTGGSPAPKPGIPPMLPRAVAPPVGDIAVSQVDASPPVIDLGTRQRIPRLVLRDAPVREVLALLARAANLNLAYINPPTPGQGGGSQAAASEPTITIDVENESVQDVFNYVLRVACVPVAAAGGAQTGPTKCTPLDANISGRTLFVGPRLPNSARNVVMRTLRMNQIPIVSALNFLVSMGAETAVSRERLVTNVNAVPVATTGALTGGNTAAPPTAITQTLTTTENVVEVKRVEYLDSVPVLRGLQVAADERTNQLTLVGTPQQVNVAVASLTQLDVRRRQVAVNVKVIDINLLALDRVSSSFSFGINDTNIINEGGIGIINFGNRSPGLTTPQLSSPGIFGNSTIGQTVGAIGSLPFNVANQFILQLQASVTNGNAKILTDPTLVVQEGQTATVNLTQEVITNFIQNITSTGSGGNSVATVTTTVEKARAGLILPVKIDRIDDNGFVALSVAPSISSPDRSVPISVNGNTNNITLLQERRVESGQIRLRDGQTLVLSGIIQDSDRVAVTKVPILGDIPLLGALFRRTERANERREVVVLVTPRVIDDNQTATFGYTFNPSPGAREMMNRSPQPPQP